MGGKKKNQQGGAAAARKTAKAARRKHRLDCKKEAKPRELARGLSMIAMPRPREDIPHDDFVRAMAAHGHNLAAKLPDIVAKLLRALKTLPTVQILKSLALRNLMSTAKGKETVHDEPHLSHLEYIQALALTLDPTLPAFLSTFVSTSDEDQLNVGELAAEAHQAFALMRLRDVVDEAGNIRLDPSKPVVEYIRLHTQSVRVPGYPYQVEEAMAGVLQRMDSTLQNVLRLRANDITRTLYAIRHIITARLKTHIAALRAAFHEKTIERIVTEYHRLFPDLKGAPADTILYLRSKGASIDDVRRLMVAHASLRLADALEVSASDIAIYTENAVSSEAADRVLSGVSLAWGSLKNEAIERFFLDNPVWRRPYVSLGDSRYLVLSPVAHHEFPWLMLETLLSGKPGAGKALAKARSEYLETKMSQILEERLPSGLHLRNAKWTHPTTGGEFETDHICVLGAVLLIAEAKSAKVQGASLRGAFGTLKDNVFDLMEYPSLQSARLVEAITGEMNGLKVVGEDGRSHILRRSDFKHIIRVNTTLDLLGLLTTRWSDLREAGLIAEEAPMAPTIPLFDLDSVAWVLRSEGAFLHYLHRRDYIERAFNYSGDELDLLGFYLKTGFCVADPRATSTRSNISLLARQFDEYLLRDERPSTKERAPQPRLSRFWKELLSKIELHPDPNVRVIGSMMLRDVAPELQVEIPASIDQAKARVRRLRRPKDNVVEVVTGHDRDPAVLLFCACDGSPDLRGREIAINAANVAAVNYKASRVLAFWFNVDRDDKPYTGMALLFYTPSP